MKKRLTCVKLATSIFCIGLGVFFFATFLFRNSPALAEVVADIQSALAQDASIPRRTSASDKNGNSINDTDDIIAGARLEVLRRPIYRSAYYQGGYPPDTEGVCTDVIWRAFKHAGYDLRTMLDSDIKANRSAYPRAKSPDSNIDFRRVPNLIVYFKRHGTPLSTQILPDREENLALWQPGDLVTFTSPDHIAILSDERNADGFPLLLHNDGPFATEGDAFAKWAAHGITGHFRFPAK